MRPSPTPNACDFADTAAIRTQQRARDTAAMRQRGGLRRAGSSKLAAVMVGRALITAVSFGSRWSGPGREAALKHSQTRSAVKQSRCAYTHAKEAESSSRGRGTPRRRRRVADQRVRSLTTAALDGAHARLCAGRGERTSGQQLVQLTRNLPADRRALIGGSKRPPGPLFRLSAVHEALRKLH